MSCSAGGQVVILSFPFIFVAKNMWKVMRRRQLDFAICIFLFRAYKLYTTEQRDVIAALDTSFVYTFHFPLSRDFPEREKNTLFHFLFRNCLIFPFRLWEMRSPEKKMKSELRINFLNGQFSFLSSSLDSPDPQCAKKGRKGENTHCVHRKRTHFTKKPKYV